MFHAELVQVVLDAGKDLGAGVFVADVLGFFFGELDGLGILFEHLLGDVDDIVAAIPALGVFGELHGQAADFAHAQVHGITEQAHLAAGVVDVVFGGNVVTGEAEQAGQGVANGGTTAMADVQGAGGVGGHVFHVDAAAITALGRTEGLALLFHVHHHFLPEGGSEGEVDKAGAGDLGGHEAGELVAHGGHDLFGHHAGSGLGLLGKHHGDVGGKVAVLHVLGSFEHSLFRPFPAVLGNDVAKGLLDEYNVAHC